MKEIGFINGKTKIRIKNNNLSAYLERIEAAGYVMKANKCKRKEGWRDVLMIGKARDFEEKLYCICSRIMRLFNHCMKLFLTAIPLRLSAC